MFSSPAIRPISRENPIDFGARKPNTNVPKSTRKPFGDRAVNDPTPNKNSNSKPKVQLTTRTPTVVSQQKDDFTDYDMCSYIEQPDKFQDICPKNGQFNSHDLLSIFLPFCNYRDMPTPPPPPESPQITIEDHLLELDRNIDLPPEFEEQSVFNVSLPDMDASLSEFDKSV